MQESRRKFTVPEEGSELRMQTYSLCCVSQQNVTFLVGCHHHDDLHIRLHYSGLSWSNPSLKLFLGLKKKKLLSFYRRALSREDVCIVGCLFIKRLKNTVSMKVTYSTHENCPIPKSENVY